MCVKSALVLSTDSERGGGLIGQGGWEPWEPCCWGSALGLPFVYPALVPHMCEGARPPAVGTDHRDTELCPWASGKVGLGKGPAMLWSNSLHDSHPVASLVLQRGLLFPYCRSRGPRRSWRTHGAHGRPRRRQRRLPTKRAPRFPGEPIWRRKCPTPSWRLAVPQPVCTSPATSQRGLRGPFCPAQPDPDCAVGWGPSVLTSCRGAFGRRSHSPLDSGPSARACPDT